MCRSPFAPGNAVGAGVRAAPMQFNPAAGPISDKIPPMMSMKDAYLSLYPTVRNDYRKKYALEHPDEVQRDKKGSLQYMLGFNSYARQRLAAELPAVRTRVEAHRKNVKAEQVAALDPSSVPAEEEDVIARSQRFSLYVLLIV